MSNFLFQIVSFFISFHFKRTWKTEFWTIYVVIANFSICE